MTISWNNRLGQVPGLPKLIPGHLYRARWIASVPCAAIPQTGSDPVIVALQQLGFQVIFATTDSNKLYGRTPNWPDSRKGPPDESGPLNCAVYTEQRWAGTEMSFLPDVLTVVPGLRVWDLWDEDAYNPNTRDLIRAGQPTTPLPLPPVPPIVPPALPGQPPVVTPPAPPGQSPAKRSSSIAWLWIPVAGLAGAIFVGTLRPAR